VLTDAAQYAAVLAELKATARPATRPASPRRWPPSTASPSTTRHQQLPVRAAGRRQQGRVPGADERHLRQGAGPALRREPAPERRLYRDLHPRPARWSRASSCRARSCPTTTSPTPTPPGNA
jgi:hypothetical protein